MSKIEQNSEKNEIGELIPARDAIKKLRDEMLRLYANLINVKQAEFELTKSFAANAAHIFDIYDQLERAENVDKRLDLVRERVLFYINNPLVEPVMSQAMQRIIAIIDDN